MKTINKSVKILYTKFCDIPEKLAKKPRGYFFLRHSVYTVIKLNSAAAHQVGDDVLKGKFTVLIFAVLDVQISLSLVQQHLT